jgi:hypothetical protein
LIGYVSLSLCLLLALPTLRACPLVLLRQRKRTCASRAVHVRICIFTRHWPFVDHNRDSYRPPDYPLHATLNTATHSQSMSTVAPSNAGVNLAWADRKQSVPPPDTETPRSAIDHLETDTCRNMIIDIPLGTQSSLLMELSHNGKVMELVARFESFTGDQDSDALKARHDHRDRVSADSENISTDLPRGSLPGWDKQIASSSPKQPGSSPRKSIPSEWKKTTRPQAPVFQTERRQEAREKKRQGAVYLTKDAGEAVSKDITSPSAPSSSLKLSRRQSKASLQSPNSSPNRTSPRHAATITISATTSPTRSPRSNVQSQGRASSAAPSAISTHGTEYHSARSHVSSHESFHSADEYVSDVLTSSPNRQNTDQQQTIQSHAHCSHKSHHSMASADCVGQTAGIRSSMSKLTSHSRSKTESEVTKSKMRPNNSNIALRIPTPHSNLANRDALYPVGSTSGYASSSPTSPIKSSSRIPRIAPTYDASTNASSLKRSQSTKSLKETKSADSRENPTAVSLKNKG